MQSASSKYGPREWSEAQRRAEKYLQLLRGQFSAVEAAELAQAMTRARAAASAAALQHPVTLVMEALFALLPSQSPPPKIAMTPPLRRTPMLPEKTEFPLHHCWRQLWRLRPRISNFAGVR